MHHMKVMCYIMRNLNLALDKAIPTASIAVRMVSLRCWVSNHTLPLSSQTAYVCYRSALPVCTPALEAMPYCKADSCCIGTGCRSSSCQIHHPSCRGSRASMPFMVPMPPLSWPCWRLCKGWMLPMCLLCLPSCHASNALLMLQKADSKPAQRLELICKVSDLLATPPLQVELECQLSRVQMHVLP